ncbi:HPP family protein [Pelotomaculum terephthalicicum JT]|uniref:HPP family protein n=1 Tax=Pelotomaculum TaxID=191373 RepID=UPI0009CAB323|nr:MULTISPECIES: HPP family protein [Pelotomaculum]MCG9969310.1 HPP family protein [Pelotomaculum terephthalicicum JT]OPX87228.1 MAG: HPP family protein [Pelotomaculum sp. PtaB.Bin117]OPY62406.1 MAG: HPP family protein [Pelotomaculum sp. PtaU1.Bin065]
MPGKTANQEKEAVHIIAKSLQLYFGKMRCQKGYCQLHASHVHWRELALSSLGCFLSMGFITLISTHHGVPLMIPSFGASVILLNTACHVSMAQPRNVVGGHVISALSGVSVYQLLSNDWWAITLAVVLAMALMTLTGTLHPPGGATAFVAVYSGQNFSFILAPVFIGSSILILIALLINNISSTRKYPQYWL